MSSSFSMQFLPLLFDFVPFCSLLRLRPSTHICPLWKTMWACLILPCWFYGPLKVFPLLFFNYFLMGWPIGHFPSSLFHWTHPRPPTPFFCLLKWAISPWLAFPHCLWVNVIYSLFLWVFLLFGPLGHNPIILLLFLNLSFLFLHLILAFVFILSNIHLTQNLTFVLKA